MDIIVMDNQENLKAIIPQYDNTTMQGHYDSEWESEINGVDTLSFNLTLGYKDKINEGDIVLFRDNTIPSNAFREFRVLLNEGIYGTYGAARLITAESAITELAQDIVTDKRIVNGSARTALTSALSGTRFSVGSVSDFGLATVNFYYISALEAIVKEMTTAYGGGEIECLTYVSTTTNKITSRSIDFVQKIGRETLRRVEVGFNSNEIKQKISMENTFTALYGRGGSIETTTEEGTTSNSRYIDFADATWTAPTNPVDKPQGQLWVGDPEALTKYGWKGKHRFGIYQNDQQLDPQLLLEETWEALQEINKPTITYEASITALNNLTLNRDGWRLGDTIVVFNEQLEIATNSRIVKITRDISDNSIGSVEIGEKSEASTGSLSRQPTIEDKLDKLEEKVDNIDPTGGGQTGVTKEELWGPDVPLSPKETPIPTQLIGAIYVEWGFLFDKGFESYQLQGFNVATQTEVTLYEGSDHIFTHYAEKGVEWQYKVRVKNKYGTYGEYSPWSVGMTAGAVAGEEILWDESIAEELRQLSITSGILASGSVDWSHLSPNVNQDFLNIENTTTQINTDLGLIDQRVTQAETQVDQVIDLVNGLQINVGTNQGYVTGADLKEKTTGWTYDETAVLPPEDDLTGMHVYYSPVNNSSDIQFKHTFDAATTEEIEITISMQYKQSQAIGSISTTVGKLYYVINGETREVSVLLKDAIYLDTTKETMMSNRWYTLTTTFKLPVGVTNMTLRSWTVSTYDQYYRSFAIESTRTSPTSSVTMLKDMINLRVSKDDIVNQINISTEGILISGSKIQITGSTFIDNAVIKSAHIADLAVTSAKIASLAVGTAAIQNLAVTNAKIANLAVGSANIQDLAVTNAKIANLAVTDAKISSLSANKLTAGTIDANKISVINLDVNNITGVTSSFIQSKWNGIHSSVSITSTGLNTYNADGTVNSRMNESGHLFYYDQKFIGFIGTNYWSGDISYRGLTFNLEYIGDYMAWGFRESPDASVYITRLSWHKTSAKVNRRGFTFYDAVTISLNDVLYLRTISTTNFTETRYVTFVNMAGISFTGTSDGIAVGIKRGDAGGRLLIGSTMAGIEGGGAGQIYVSVTSGGDGYVYSASIYNRTASSSDHVGISSGGILNRITSASKYKLDIQEVVDDGLVKHDFKKVLNLKPKSWFDKADSERLADELTAQTMGVEIDLTASPVVRHYGLIAEDLVDQGLTQFVNYNEDGEVEGIQYDRIWTYTLPIIAEHEQKIADQEGRIKALEALIAQ